uniref:RING-type E3 ubiquitin transferase n=1 Tax=Tetraselmis sp. GSL018 TaxID=582737 RepID=A0A061RY84_9CHLO
MQTRIRRDNAMEQPISASALRGGNLRPYASNDTVNSPVIHLVRLFGCGGCCRRRRDRDHRSRGSTNVRSVTVRNSSHSVVTPSVPCTTGNTPNAQSSRVGSVAVPARDHGEHSETESLLSKTQTTKIDTSFSASPELPKASLPKGFHFIEDDWDADTCPTCLEGYAPDNPKIDTFCKHHFHLSCIYEWLERSKLCPVCSAPMRTASGKKFLEA